MARKKYNPMCGIYRRGRIYWIAIQRNGVREFFSLETDNVAEALRKAQMIREAPPLNDSSPLRAEMTRFIAYKERMKEYTRSSALTKRNKLLQFAKEMPDHASAASVTTRQLQHYYDTVRQRATDTTAYGYMMALQAFFRWAVDERLAHSNPVKQVKLAKSQGRARQDFCGYELRNKLITEAPDDDLRFILFCGFHAGLRFMEIGEARAFWFDLGAGLLHLRKTPTMNFKDREERTVPLTKAFHAFLKGYGMHEPFMLRPEIKQGKSLYRYNFRRAFMVYMKSQGCERVTPHIMRHTFASLLVSAGESIYKVAVWLGDEVGTVQRHYGHLTPDHHGIEKAFSMRVAHV